jgi:hypothetical protein
LTPDVHWAYIPRLLDLPHHPDGRRGKRTAQGGLLVMAKDIKETLTSSVAWTPKFTLDLQAASAKAFANVLEDFETWRQTEPQRELDLSNGWKIITQQTAEGMLLRNPVGSNRKPTLPTVTFYARQMETNEWKKTGQPILFDTEGKLLDAGHRLWAAYLSGASFPSYVIGDVPADESLFAYIDNCKARTAADALATAGLNGLSKQLGSVISIAMQFEHNCFTASTKKPLGKVAPIEVVHYAKENESLRQAVRLMAGEHKAAAKTLLYKDVAGFLAFQILELHGEEVLDDFMAAIGRVGENEHDEGSPIAAIQKVMEEDQHSNEPMQKHQILGHAIKAFNAYVLGEKVKKITLKVNETYPRFVRPQSEQQAAE